MSKICSKGNVEINNKHSDGGKKDKKVKSSTHITWINNHQDHIAY